MDKTDPKAIVLESPISANVWKIFVTANEVLHAEQPVLALEAMKLEISIKADSRFHGCRVKKVLVRPGDTIEGGAPLLICTKGNQMIRERSPRYNPGGTLV